jgi:GMP synthase-like glutamine amidotransferase
MLLIITTNKPDNVNRLGNLCKTLQERDIPYEIIGSPDPNIIKRKDIRGIIFPGARYRIQTNDIQPELDLELYYLHHFPKLPVLGICHGCQLLMTYYGGDLVPYNSYWIGSNNVELDISKDRIFYRENRQQRLYFYFHELPVMTSKAEKAGVREIAWIKKFRDGQRRACAFEFEKNRVYGCMFHPEAKKESRSIIYNFYDKVCNEAS